MSEPSAAAAGAAADLPPAGRLATPTVLRRMASFLYEGVLLFGVLFVCGLVYAIAVHQTSGIEKRPGLMAVSFVILGVYFIGFWTRAGQTLPMKTWHLRVLTEHGQPLTPRRALARYLASWVWFMPPILLAGALPMPNAWSIFGLMAAWIALYALSALLHPSRQFWHDTLCGTAIVTSRPAAPLPQ